MLSSDRLLWYGGRVQLLALFQFLPARIGRRQLCLQSSKTLHNGLKRSGITAKQVWVCQLRMQPRLLRFQGFDALGKGVEFTLLRISQALARPFNEGW